jgi:hypothetical protein
MQLIYLMLGMLQFRFFSNLISIFVWSTLVVFFQRLEFRYLRVALGICTVVPFGYALLTATVFQEATWAPFKASYQVQGGLDAFTPNDPIADYVVRQFGIQGAGKIRVSMRAKSDRPQVINFTLLQFGSDIRFDKPCQLQTAEVVCEIAGFFPDRRAVAGAFGSFQKAEWKRGDARILVSRFEMEYLVSPPIGSYFQGIPRAKSIFFNANAFGAVSALLALMCWFAFGPSLGLVMVVLNLGSIILSGSQNSLLAFLTGSLILLLSRRGRPVLLVGGLLVLVMLELGLNILPSFRIFNTDPGERNLERLAIWTHYLRSGLESSVMFGRGGLPVPGLGLNLNAEHGHNLWVQVFYQSGILGFAGMVLLWLVAFWKGFAHANRQRISILVCILALNLFDYTFYFWPVQLMFWLAAIGWKPRA